MLSRPAGRRALASFEDTIARLGKVGYAEVERVGPLEARLRSLQRRPSLRVRMTTTGGRIFGGTYALEISTDEPVLPPTRGLSARGKGIVRMQGVRFRARGDDFAGRELAERLAADDHLGERLARVHFEQIRIDPDGRPVIRHLGGSVVWILFPPIVKQIPFVPEQIGATLAALEAFSAAGRG
jgi:hypothetical protein